MRRNEDAGTPALTASDGAERSDAKETQTAPASLKALCAIAAFHQIAAEPAKLAHQLGLTPSEPIGKSDILLAAKHLSSRSMSTAMQSS
jgi:subfamily B ATP-binding cassette protein HlyB/CyaB